MPFRRFRRALLGALALFPLLLAAQVPVVPNPDARVQAALAAAEQGRFDPGAYPELTGHPGHPLYGWVQFAQLRHDIATLPASRANRFLQDFDGEAVATAFRELWLAETARRQDWVSFRAAWSPSIRSTALRCAELQARQTTSGADA